MTRTKAAILFIAAGLFTWATCSYLTGIGTDADFKLPAIACLLLLGFALWLDYRVQEHRTDERRRREIQATWARRDWEAGLR